MVRFSSRRSLRATDIMRLRRLIISIKGMAAKKHKKRKESVEKISRPKLTDRSLVPFVLFLRFRTYLYTFLISIFNSSAASAGKP